MIRLILAVLATALINLPKVRAQDVQPKPLVLLAGATGNNGSAILGVLKDAPFRVRAMTRDAKKAIAKFGPVAEWVEADVTKPETLVDAMRGVDFVIDAVAATGIMGNNKPEVVDFKGTENLTVAAKAAGVKRFVIITSSVSGKKDHFLNYIGNDVLIYKGKAEEVLIASGIPYVIIGPTAMTDDPRGLHEIKLIPRSDYKGGTKITRGDVGLVALESLTNPDAANKAFTVFNGDGPATKTWTRSFVGLPAK